MKLFKSLLTCIISVFIIAGCSGNKDTDSTAVSDKWTVSFDFNDGRGEYLSRKVEKDTLITRPTNPYREGYNFIEWYRDTYCLLPWIFEEDKVTANTTLFAGWEIKSTSNEFTITWPTETGYKINFEGTKPTVALLNTVISFTVTIDDNYEGAPKAFCNGTEISRNNETFSFTVYGNSNITITGIKEKGDIIIPTTEYYLEVNGTKKGTFLVNEESTAPDTVIEYYLTANLNANDSVKIKDSENKYFLNWENATAGSAYIAPRSGDYTFYFKFKSDSTQSIYIIKASGDITGENYKLYFTLPSWTPVAENPRLYYWGSGEGAPEGSIFTAGAQSNMTLDSGSTYYIEVDTSFDFSGIIIIFDQGGQVKQSVDITTGLPTAAGNYTINGSYESGDWNGNKFKATITAR